jgi:hypothetical protein
MSVEESVEWELARETGVFRDNPAPSNISSTANPTSTDTGSNSGPQPLEASD